MIADEALTYTTQTPVACEACGLTLDVTWYCKNCPGSLCGSCKDAHKSASITSKHSVVLRTIKVIRSHGPAKIAEQCRLHLDKEISVYCMTCNVSCCIFCFAEKHQRHEFSPIEEKYLAAERRLNDYTKYLEKDVMPKLDDMEAQVRSEVKDGDQQREKVKEEVNAFREEIKQVVDETCDSLIDALYQPKSDLNDRLRDIDKQKKKVNDLIQSCSDKVREGKLDIIEYIPPTPSSLLPTLTPPKSCRPVFVPGREVLDIIRNELGSLTCHKGVTKPSLVSFPERMSHFPSKFDKTIINVEMVSFFKSNIGATSITTAGNNTAWVIHNLRDTMYLYNDNGEVVRYVTVMNGVCIIDMVITPSGEMIVTNVDMKVRCVSMRGEVSTLIDTTPFSAHGVCLTNRGEIMVCMSGQGLRNHLAVYSSDGRKKQCEIRSKDSQGKQLFTKPVHVVQNCEDLCVVNGGGNVVCVTERGNVRWVYDGMQAKLKGSFNPWGICRDRYHNLLVTDSNNHCVHYIDSDGHLIQVILTEEQIGLPLQFGISVDDVTGLVWVGNVYSYNIVVAKYIEKTKYKKLLSCTIATSKCIKENDVHSEV